MELISAALRNPQSPIEDNTEQTVRFSLQLDQGSQTQSTWRLLEAESVWDWSCKHAFHKKSSDKNVLIVSSVFIF